MYIINEYQTDANGNVAIVTPVQETTWNSALSTFYLKCHYAAASDLPKHTVTLSDENGTDYDHKVFYAGDGTPSEEI